MIANSFWREKMSLFILLHLLTLLHANFGTPSQPIYVSLSWLPTLPSLARMNSPKHVSIASMGTSLNQFIDFQRRHFQYLPAAPAQSPASKGPFSSSRHRRHRHRIRNHAVPISPSTTPGCDQTCPIPLASVPFGSPCGCVIPMSVRLLIGVPAYAIYPEVNELAIEVAAGTYLKQSQVSIVGVNANDQNLEKTIVTINLVPLGEKFDNTTATLTYIRFLHKKVPLNKTLFGDYDVMCIGYPGLPCSPQLNISCGEGPCGVTGNLQRPINADFDGKYQKMNPTLIFVLSLSGFVLLVLCFATIAVILNWWKSSKPSNAVESVFASSKKKRHGIGSKLSSSPASSTSTSLVSAMPAFVLSVKTFPLAEVKKATENFSPKKLLGEGGFGRVYHGIMDDGTEVAVKLLTRNNHDGDREFIAEIEMLSRLHHRNLVKLIGMCFEKQIRCLVYELVPNGSVESHLHGANRSKEPLDWDARLKIALGAARGLAYLHEESNPRVIHRDFKASNVLLENDFSPKVSDFGLAREATEGSHHVSTRVMGTFGYVAPEYAMTGHLLVKSDVYSYGVVLLELLSGRMPVDMSQHPGQENLVTWARPLLTNREGLEQLVDPSLAGSYNFDDMAKVAAIASMCVHPEVTHRPFMGEVVQALKLIYNDIDETCGDAYSQKGSSAHYSDFKGDFAPSDSRSNAGGTTPHLTHGQASSYITMEYSSGSSCEGFGALPTSHSNRLIPSRIVETNRAFYRLERSMSEHGAMHAKRVAMGSRGRAASI